MDVGSREQRLADLLRAEAKLLPDLVESVRHERTKVRLGVALCGLAQRAQTQALHAYFVAHDIHGFKQNCYLASKLTLASVGQDGGAVFEIGTDFLYGLMSDNTDVVRALSQVEVPQLIAERDNPISSRFQVHMWQLAIRDENDALLAKIEKLSKHGARKTERAACATGRDFFSLLVKRDAAGLKELIENRHSRIKSDGTLFDDFVAFRATLETKLCWFKGIPVEIDSPLVPMELMALKPLERYDDVYDFLKSGWVPPQQGLLGKVSRWISGKN